MVPSSPAVDSAAPVPPGAALLPRLACVLADLTGTAEGATPATDLAGDLALDSLDAIELAMKVEDRFGVTITDAEAMACRTVGDILALLDAKNPAPETQAETTPAEAAA